MIAMTIIRRKVTRNFTVIANDCFNDETLSGEEIGLIAFLLSRPHNWNVRLPALKKRMRWGRDKTYDVLNSLSDKGYIERRQGRDSRTGSFGRVEYFVYDGPIATLPPLPEKPEAEPRPPLPLPANPKAAKAISTDSHQVLPSFSPHAQPVDKQKSGHPSEKERPSSRPLPPQRPSSSAAPSQPPSPRGASRSSSDNPTPWTKRGQLEMEITTRIGDDGVDILSALPEWHLNSLCERQRDGTLDDAAIAEIKMSYLEAKSRSSTAKPGGAC
jgi:hypothetical protein